MQHFILLVVPDFVCVCACVYVCVRARVRVRACVQFSVTTELSP